MRAFLIGGRAQTPGAHRPFAESVTADGPVIVYLLDEPAADPSRWERELAGVGVRDVRVLVVSPNRLPRAEDLRGAAGLYVAGGLTPGYRDVLVGAGTGWLGGVRENALPYAGFSAGAAIASRQALVGGWRAQIPGGTVQVSHEDNGEDLEHLTIEPGLGIVDFMVDVHAAQWGTLHRLVYAVLGDVGPDQGWAIDEGTALEALDGVPVAVHGTGAATSVQREGSGVRVRVHLRGELEG